MTKATWTFAVSAALSLATLGCGSSSNPSGKAGPQTLSGLASAESPVTTVSLKAAGSPSALTTTPDVSGAFSFDVAGRMPPFLLKAESTSGSEYAVAVQSGVVNVNAISTVVAAASSPSKDPEKAWSGQGFGQLRGHRTGPEEPDDRAEAALRPLRRDHHGRR